MDTPAPPAMQTLLATAKPDDMIVVAVLAADGGAAIHTARPDARRLTNLASSLLDQAADMLRDSDAPADIDLVLAIDDALDILPDRHADPADTAEG